MIGQTLGHYRIVEKLGEGAGVWSIGFRTPTRITRWSVSSFSMIVEKLNDLSDYSYRSASIGSRRAALCAG